MIIGSVATGKTALLMSLLGEMEKSSIKISESEEYYDLSTITGRSIAYVP